MDDFAQLSFQKPTTGSSIDASFKQEVAQKLEIARTKQEATVYVFVERVAVTTAVAWWIGHFNLFQLVLGWGWGWGWGWSGGVEMRREEKEDNFDFDFFFFLQGENVIRLKCHCLCWSKLSFFQFLGQLTS